ncbi:hypothetical protein IAQ61_003393 [Plenodomus lingam]|uniref:uncharacterized protein n=1 Tax=Leptosphaeria maculans TaxID=5022 RepID=UPI003317EE88|nr:hypothetical protein IAQ61_003393 [Plenodomus lingam]
MHRGVDYEADVDWLRNQGSRGRRTLARETYRLHHFYQRAIDSDAVMQEEHAPSTEVDIIWMHTLLCNSARID